jgi:hypothetical protein
MKRLAVLLFVLIVGAGVAALASAEVATSRAKRTNARETFDSPGTHTWTSPQAGTVTFDVFGAQGGDRGGKGGEARASFHVTEGQTLEVVVGGAGGREGGFNGGGKGTGHSGGGGGSDVRLGACASSKSCGLEDRIIVAGGGGGNASFGERAHGGDGGGRTGGTGKGDFRDEGGGGGGTQSRGGGDFTGCSPKCYGSFGDGGSSPHPYCLPDSGGGGGGWFGGGAGTARCDAAAGGGGGSGFISPFAVSGSFPGGKQSGHGKVIVSFP